jgi:hypothetical protein
MATVVKGDRESKSVTVFAALDRAFFDRVSRIFDTMCDYHEPSEAAAWFVERFKTATDKWNECKAAIEQEYPK